MAPCVRQACHTSAGGQQFESIPLELVSKLRPIHRFARHFTGWISLVLHRHICSALHVLPQYMQRGAMISCAKQALKHTLL